MKAPAKWTDDCQGKKDYDGVVLRISTRYWPQGGGFGLFDHATGIMQQNEDRPHIQPSAKSCFILESKGIKEDEINRLELITENFKGDTEQEVKEKVEKWVQFVYYNIECALRDMYGK